VARGLRTLAAHLHPAPGDQPSAALARLLGEHLVRRATHPPEET